MDSSGLHPTMVERKVYISGNTIMKLIKKVLSCTLVVRLEVNKRSFCLMKAFGAQEGVWQWP
jgi:hypothetical protein